MYLNSLLINSFENGTEQNKFNFCKLIKLISRAGGVKQIITFKSKLNMIEIFLKHNNQTFQ